MENKDKKEELFGLKNITIHGENGETVTFSDVDVVQYEVIGGKSDVIGDFEKAEKTKIKGRYSSEPEVGE